MHAPSENKSTPGFELEMSPKSIKSPMSPQRSMMKTHYPAASGTFSATDDSDTAAVLYDTTIGGVLSPGACGLPPATIATSGSPGSPGCPGCPGSAGAAGIAANSMSHTNQPPMPTNGYPGTWGAGEGAESSQHDIGDMDPYPCLPVSHSNQMPGQASESPNQINTAALAQQLQAMEAEVNNAKKKFSQRTKWITVLICVLTVHTLCIIFLLFGRPQACQCQNANNTSPPSAPTDNFDDTQSSTYMPSSAPSVASMQSIVTSSEPSRAPMRAPTHAPTHAPFVGPGAPTSMQSSFPTNESDALSAWTSWSVGDFKVSFINESHDFWLLCDGSMIDSRNYSLLFETIGIAFGSLTSEDGVQFFALPDATDRVVAMAGRNRISGDVVDFGESINISLTNENIPSHFHYLMNSQNDGCKGDWNESLSYKYLAEDCYYSSDLLTDGADKYELRATDLEPTQGQTSTVGDNQDVVVSVMQPTVFVGNLFIYAGQRVV